MHGLTYSPVPWTLVGPWCKGGIYQFGLLEGGDFVAPSTLPNRSVRSRPASAKVSCIYFLLLPAPARHIFAHWMSSSLEGEGAKNQI